MAASSLSLRRYLYYSLRYILNRNWCCRLNAVVYRCPRCEIVLEEAACWLFAVPGRRGGAGRGSRPFRSLEQVCFVSTSTLPHQNLPRHHNTTPSILHKYSGYLFTTITQYCLTHSIHSGLIADFMHECLIDSSIPLHQLHDQLHSLRECQKAPHEIEKTAELKKDTT